MMPAPFRALPLALALFILPALGAFAQSPSIPITGPFLPGMDRVDATITGLMTKHGSPGAQLAVTRNGRLMLARGYGYADREAGIAVQPDSLFRIASESKFITAVAVLQLAEQNRLSLDATAFTLIPQITALPGATVDPRLKNITVRQLLQHTGGWDRDISGDPMFNPIAAAAATATGTPPPASAAAIIRYMMGRPLDFDPGTRYAYSNFGYNILGRIIEAITGQTYHAFVQTALFSRAGITRAALGRSLLADRLPGEVRYYDYANAPLVASVFPPTTNRVPRPYGSFNLEAMDAHGQWIMNTPDYVRFIAAVDGSKLPALLNANSLIQLTARPAAPVSVGAAAYYGAGISVRPISNNSPTGANWWHSGALSGTETHFVRLSNGWSYAAFFNTRPQTGDISGDLDAVLGNLLVTITPPAGDLFTSALPEIVAPPTLPVVSPGGTATLTVDIVSLSSPTYQWSKNGVPISGATNPSLILANLSVADNGAYRVTVTNAAGNVTSTPAALSLPGINPDGRLINLSILTALSGSNDDFSMGYVAGGAGTSGTKPLVIRAAGPSLGALGVPDTLADPKLELFLGNTLTGQNDNWGGAPALATAMASVGAFAYAAPTSRDAATLATINAGENNSVKVSGTGAGTVIAELYDATPSDSFLFTTPRLLNVSVLKHLGTGLTVGFSVGGTTAMKVLVRVVGPTLGAAPFNLAGVVADPQLALFNGTTRIGENNDWGGSAALTAAFGQVAAFALPATSRDAALLVTLEPGSYSAQVSGVNTTTGVAIVEVYEIP